MARTWTKALLLGVGMLLAWGCASTPERRISRNRALFDTFPPEAQEKVRRGEVDLGFSPDMVRLALGEPERVYRRTTEAGEAEVWDYTGGGRRLPVTTSFGLGIGGGVGGGVGVGTGAGVSVPVGSGQAERALRVEFRNGAVSALETLQP